jgi:hypothetical protein
MGLAGVLLGLLLLVWFAFRGWSVLLLAPAAALVAAAFAGEPLLAHWTQTFMGGAARFVGRLARAPVAGVARARPIGQRRCPIAAGGGGAAVPVGARDARRGPARLRRAAAGVARDRVRAGGGAAALAGLGQQRDRGLAVVGVPVRVDRQAIAAVLTAATTRPAGRLRGVFSPKENNQQTIRRTGCRFAEPQGAARAEPVEASPPGPSKVPVCPSRVSSAAAPGTAVSTAGGP